MGVLDRIGMLAGEDGGAIVVMQPRTITPKQELKQSLKQVIIGLLTKMTAQATELRQNMSVVVGDYKDRLWGYLSSTSN